MPKCSDGFTNRLHTKISFSKKTETYYKLFLYYKVFLNTVWQRPNNIIMIGVSIETTNVAIIVWF